MKILLIILVLLIGTNCLFAQEDTYQTITARVDGVLYKAIYKSSDLSISIINPRGKVINCIGDGAVWRLRFIDFNRDGYKDLFIEYISNVPGDNLLLLYNNKMRTFVEVEGFENFFNASRLGNDNLYYSYERAGCADFNWNSDLFKIVNYKAVKIGYIAGLGCEGDNNLGVFIYKINGAKEQLIKTYPIIVIKKYREYKWGFIKQYWERNYRKFI
jgi:hypothetical protein